MKSEHLYKYQERLFDIFIYISYFLMIVSIIGMIKLSPKYLTDLNYYISVYICLYLIWRFNPLRKYYEFTNLDRKIAFSAGVFILTTTTMNVYIDVLKMYIKQVITLEGLSFAKI